MFHENLNKRNLHLNTGYYWIHYPEHPNSYKNGMILLHRCIMENKLGRYLETNELVHHIDENRLNNNIDNLELTNRSEHARHHHKDIEKNIYNYKCSYCNQDYIARIISSKYCSEECYRKASRKVIRPSKLELSELIWKIPSTLIADFYNVSDKAICKWCKQYEIEKPPRGYWAKQKKYNK